MAEGTKGLAGVAVADTTISYIDGEAGRLFYRGYDIHPLAGKGSFAEALYLLWYGELPTGAELAVFEGLLARERRLPDALVGVLRQLPTDATPMSALRTTVSVLGELDADAGDNSREANLRKAGRLVAMLPVAVAAHHRLQRGDEPVAPDPELGQAADFLRMLTGEPPADTAAAALDTSLLLYLEHGFNASTFACRVVASTLADLHAALTAGVAALSGPLHGGANEHAMRMLEEIGSVEAVDDYLDRELAAGRKIMGFGHRVYRTEDPRSTHLRKMSKRLGESMGDASWYELSRAVEAAMLDRKGLYCNVDFYCATVYRNLDIPLDLFTPLFALGRTGGWAAHVMEQYADNRLIRPRANYTGAIDRPYVLIERRD
ncbi:MAG TPA: citrate/2-methylcitrate synthase [Gemmatimonadota bacterium]|nr:citrate/2-methylcitrate synthase [Gemmatimonadota bacterium]